MVDAPTDVVTVKTGVPFLFASGLAKMTTYTETSSGVVGVSSPSTNQEG